MTAQPQAIHEYGVTKNTYMDRSGCIRRSYPRYTVKFNNKMATVLCIMQLDQNLNSQAIRIRNGQFQLCYPISAGRSVDRLSVLISDVLPNQTLHLSHHSSSRVTNSSKRPNGLAQSYGIFAAVRCRQAWLCIGSFLVDCTTTINLIFSTSYQEQGMDFVWIV